MDYKTHIMRAINYIENNLKNNIKPLIVLVCPVIQITILSVYSRKQPVLHQLII